MQEWNVVDQFGNMIAQGFYDKQSAEFYAKNIYHKFTIMLFGY